MRGRSLFALAIVAALLLALVAVTPATASYRDDVIGDLDDLEGKLVGLAEAIPAEKYGWRPADGVRSVSESLMHVAGGNFFFPNLRDMKPPESVNMQGLEQITDKTEVISTLKASFAHAKKAAEGVSDDELGNTMDMFGREVTVSGFLHAMASHCHEHLGQMIAYARSIGVAPPWSGGGQ